MLVGAWLTINGVSVPVAGASIKAPSRKLGASVTIALAVPDVTSVPQGASVTFEVGAGAGSPVVWSRVPYMSLGKLLGRAYNISWIPRPGKPGDTVQFSAISPLADRLGLAPERPVILYNPDTVDSQNLVGDTSNYDRDALTGAAILPVLEPVSGLTLKAVLDRAFTNRPPNLSRQAATLSTSTGRDIYAESLGVGTGAGFNSVVTNIGDYPVDRVDFSEEGGWLGGVQALIAPYEAEVFEDSNTLYIIDPDKGLPAGLQVRALPLSCFIDLNETVEATEIVNVLRFSYLTRTPPVDRDGNIIIQGAIPSIERPVLPATESGQGRSYVRVETYPEFEVWKDLTTGQVVARNEIQTETRKYTYRDKVQLTPQAGGRVKRQIVPGGIVETSVETVQTHYQGKLKKDSLRKISAVYYDPNVKGAPDSSLREVMTETNRLEWRPDVNSPGESELVRSITETEGIVLVEKDRDGNKLYTPILQAQSSGLIKGDGSQYTTRMPIRTVIEELRDSGFNQSAVITTEFNLLTGSVEVSPPVYTRTGSRSTAQKVGNRVTQAAFTVRERITDVASIAAYGKRRAASLSLGEVEPELARRIARRRLYRLANPRQSVTVTLPGIDFTIRRGSLLRPARRSGYSGTYMVTGWTITIRGLGTEGVDVKQVLECIEVSSLL